jgi:NADH-quinone oxidoreductase subunit L
MVAWLVFLPLIGALITGLFNLRINQAVAQTITSGLMLLSSLLAAVVFYDVVIDKHSYTVILMDWIQSGNFKASWALNIDSLTAVMLVVVTWVSTLVHIYSVGYMSHDPNVPRFMSYLSLFTFFMLMLVTSDNLIQLFLGWEGVGLCSYLLIGFWYKKPSASAAAMKAFIVNRVGDFGFALGIFAIFMLFGSVQFSEIFANAFKYKDTIVNIMGYPLHALTAICILLFIGSMGKSAQIGLHTWLPDAMEGPTPVSALIHAATMVTAGVFLVARCSPLFEYAPNALAMVTIVGAVTALFAATIALVQNDIKRIIAYSTCSQLGYMFFACGVSAYSAGVFHLMTHAFFKALLFLGAGSVIHAMSDEQDIRNMGGIWKKIPATYALMWIGSLALVGIFPFAGYYSKDLILESAFASGTIIGYIAFAFGIIAAFCTAFYSARLLILVFHGSPRASENTMAHIHESPMVMMVPLLLLAVGAVIAGYIGVHVLHMVEAGTSFWGNAVKGVDVGGILEKAHHIPSIVKLLPLIIGFAGFGLAFVFYMLMPRIPAQLARNLNPFYKLLLNKYYIDELYDAIFVRPLKALGVFLWKIIDSKIIDGVPNGMAWLSRQFSVVLSRLQTGYLYHYAFVMLIGMLGLISWGIVYSGWTLSIK